MCVYVNIYVDIYIYKYTTESRLSEHVVSFQNQVPMPQLP